MRLHIPIILAILIIISCQETITISTDEPAEVIIESDSSDSVTIFIRDKTFKKWDITHAVNKYGFDPARFQYGLGPFAIRPILSPLFLSPNDSGYPSINDDDIVIGIVLNGITKAYPLRKIKQREIVDERFDSIAVAVGY
jgi:hypothetical protein